MKQATLLSGKGGTGKTTITASFAALSSKAVFADCDVDASNLHLLLNPEVKETIEFKGLKLARIDQEKCTQCGQCMEKCRFNAIKEYTVDPIHCEGCKVCVEICPVKAVDFIDRVCGHAYISETKYGPMAHARLIPGMENSGKLVTLVRQNAQKIAKERDRDLVLADGPPGIGCPVIASLSNIDAGIVVVEPTLSGIHDLKRALDLLNHFKIEPLVCINKYDLNIENNKQINEFCEKMDVAVVGRVPFDENVVKAMVDAKPVIEYVPNSKISKSLTKTWEKIRDYLELSLS